MTWKDYTEWRGYYGTECATGCEVFAIHSMLNTASFEFYSDKTLKAADGKAMVNYDACITNYMKAVDPTDPGKPSDRAVMDYINWDEAN